MNNHAKIDHWAAAQRTAVLLLCFCLMAMGNADVYALCFSQSHAGGSAIHHVAHKMASAEKQGNSQKCDADQYSHENRCIDVLLPAPAKNIQTQFTVQSPAIIDSGAMLDADAMALFFTRRPAVASLFPAPSPPIIFQTQTFLN